MLSAAQMARMSELLEQALDLDRAERQRWLRALAPQDRDLEAALREALLPQESEHGPLDAPPRIDTVGAEPDASGPQPGTRIGPYVLVRPLGEGGMAEVWLARRADGAYQREVALKLPMLSGRRQDLAGRFARERDILAQLEHPHIARLYDAGVSGEGLPYLAMEYVPGQALTAWCDRQRVGLRERLRLFLQVLDAVQYAHDRHVLHRDIKPSNILVTETGQVGLLDFGVAKLLAAQPEHTELTEVYGRALTPDYASPELLRGDEVDAASDIYALGVVLYELLAGSRPYRLKAGGSRTALEQAVLQAQVQRPSTQIDAKAAQARTSTPVKLARRLRGDLDAIVLKALQLDPKERYLSAEALAADLQRYLRGEPVEARTPHALYRGRKFVLRHRTGVAATSLIVLLALAFVYQYRALHLRDAADRHAVIAPLTLTAAIPDKSIAVLPFLDMSQKHDQEYFSDGLTEELIDRLSHSPDLKVIARTSCFYFKGKQATIAEIAHTLGVANILEGSVRKAGQVLRITVQLIRASDSNHLWSETYERSLKDIFRVQEEIARTVFDSLKVALGADTRPAAAHEPGQQAYNLFLKANFFANRNTREDARTAIDLYEQAVRADPSFALGWAKLAWTHEHGVGNAWETIPQGIAPARQSAQRALAIDPDLAFTHKTMGALARDYDWDWPAAQSFYRRAQQLEPGDFHAKADLAFLSQGMLGRFDETIANIQQILARDPLDLDALHDLGWMLAVAGRFDEAAAAFRQLLTLNPAYAAAQSSLAIDLLLLNRRDEALAAAQSEPDDAYRLFTLALVHGSLGRNQEADAELAEFERKYAAAGAYNLAQVHAFRGEAEPAMRWLERAHRQHDAGMIWLRIDPLLRRLHTDARYRALLATMKLDGAEP